MITPKQKSGGGVPSCALLAPDETGRELPNSPVSPLEKWICAHQAESERYPPASIAPLMGAKRRAELAKIDAQVAALSSAV